MKRRSSILAAAIATLCLAGGLVSAFALAAGRAGVTTITVTAGKPSEYKFTLSKTTVSAGATVVFKVVNKGKKPHNFVIAGKKTPLLARGKSATLKVVFQAQGKFPYSSAVAGQSGMKGVFSVTAALPTPTVATTTTAAPPVSTCANPTASTVNVSLFEYGITLSQSAVPCGTVTFMVTNTGTISHSFDVVGVAAGPVLAPAGTTTVTANFTKAGSFHYQCDVGNHAAMGMAGTLTVS